MEPLAIPPGQLAAARGLLTQRGLVSATVAVLLGCAVLTLWWTNARHMRQRDALAAAEQHLAQLQQDRLAVEQRVMQARLVKQLLETAKSRGLYFAQWNERSINIKQVSMKRAALNSLLRELDANDAGALDLDLFELSVRQPSEGLFTASSDAASEVMVSIKGRMLFKTSLAPEHSAT